MASRSTQSLERTRLKLVPRGGVDGRRPCVFIVGASFAGRSVAKRLAKAPVDITLIDRENHHLFQPLLYQVATAGLSPADIAWPIRGLVRHQRNTRVLLGAVTGVDRVRKRVNMGDRDIPYDVLVLATAATHGCFGNGALRRGYDEMHLLRTTPRPGPTSPSRRPHLLTPRNGIA